MKKLSEYPNIGPVVEKQLHQVGIDTLDQLQDIGSQEAWLRIQQIDSSASIACFRSYHPRNQEKRFKWTR